MNKSIVLCMGLFALLLSGCVNISQEICIESKHMVSNRTIYYDAPFCVVEYPNATHIHKITCKSAFERANILVKNNYADYIDVRPVDTEGLINQCEVVSRELL